MKNKPDHTSTHAQAGVAFLLSQLGSHSAARFAGKLKPLGLSPPHVGILRIISRGQGLTQRALAQRLNIFASRLVVLLDELEERGLVERRETTGDRRSYALHVTNEGTEVLRKVERTARQQEDELCAALSAEEKAQLSKLLARIAVDQRLDPGVHPGYRRMGRSGPEVC